MTDTSNKPGLFGSSNLNGNLLGSMLPIGDIYNNLGYLIIKKDLKRVVI